MVGTSAIVAFRCAKAVDGAAQRGDGAGDHGAARHRNSIWLGMAGAASPAPAAEADLIKRRRWPPSAERHRIASVERRASGRDIVGSITDRACARQFMIKHSIGYDLNCVSRISLDRGRA